MFERLTTKESDTFASRIQRSINDVVSELRRIDPLTAMSSPHVGIKATFTMKRTSLYPDRCAPTRTFGVGCIHNSRHADVIRGRNWRTLYLVECNVLICLSQKSTTLPDAGPASGGLFGGVHVRSDRTR